MRNTTPTLTVILINVTLGLVFPILYTEHIYYTVRTVLCLQCFHNKRIWVLIDKFLLTCSVLFFDRTMPPMFDILLGETSRKFLSVLSRVFYLLHC